MPRNNNVEQKGFPMAVRFHEGSKTEFKNNLESIKVSLIQYPTYEELLDYVPGFVDATWNDTPYIATEYSEKEKKQLIYDAIHGKTLPTVMETFRFTFLIEGISLQEVTHILRHRGASFSADCSADKWWNNKAALVPNSIEHSEEFYNRYKKIVKEAKQLYCDIIDSKKCSIMDARYILPRCLETYYYMSMNLKDVIGFLHQRVDRMIQPETDNILAYKMYLEMLKKCYYIYDLIDINETPIHYVKTATTKKCTRLYVPDANADKFEWNEKDILYYPQHRNDMNGTDVESNSFHSRFLKMFDKLYGEIKTQEDINRENFGI